MGAIGERCCTVGRNQGPRKIASTGRCALSSFDGAQGHVWAHAADSTSAAVGQNQSLGAEAEFRAEVDTK